MLTKLLMSSIISHPLSIGSHKAQTQHSISEFLHSSRARYEGVLTDPQKAEIIHFVMGNQSADLDSVISSISYAYFLSRENPATHAELYIPLMNIHREEIALRKDILYVFGLFGISLNDILFLDDNAPLDSLFTENRLRLNLVDHNILRPRQEHLSDAVERIVDHHFDENKYYPLMTDHDKSIAVVGSNATLIAEKILSSNAAISPELAVFLLAPILIDTANLISVEKTTPRDACAAKALQDIASSHLPDDFYDTLAAAKNDSKGLTPAMLLSKDFKEFLQGNIVYGISSLPFTVRWGKSDLEAIAPIIQEHAHKRDLAFLILLMFSDEPQIKRKILVYSRSSDLLKKIDAYMQTDQQLKEILIPDFFSKKLQMGLYRSEQMISRKQLQPLLKLPFLGSWPNFIFSDKR